jgi:hypothetical protein
MNKLHAGLLILSNWGHWRVPFFPNKIVWISQYSVANYLHVKKIPTVEETQSPLCLFVMYITDHQHIARMQSEILLCIVAICWWSVLWLQFYLCLQTLLNTFRYPLVRIYSALNVKMLVSSFYFVMYLIKTRKEAIDNKTPEEHIWICWVFYWMLVFRVFPKMTIIFPIWAALAPVPKSDVRSLTCILRELCHPWDMNAEILQKW